MSTPVSLPHVEDRYSSHAQRNNVEDRLSERSTGRLHTERLSEGLICRDRFSVPRPKPLPLNRSNEDGTSPKAVTPSSGKPGPRRPSGHGRITSDTIGSIEESLCESPSGICPGEEVLFATDPISSSTSRKASKGPSTKVSPRRKPEAPTPRPRKEVQTVLNELTKMPLHVVQVGHSKDELAVLGRDTGSPELARRIYDIPPHVQAVILLTYISCHEATMRIIKSFKKQVYAPPVVVLLLRIGSAKFDVMHVQNATRELTKLGADAVVLQPLNKLDLPDVLQTTLALVDVNVELENHLIDAIHERANTLFFENAHRIIPGFPQMNPAVEEIAASDGCLGGVGGHMFVGVIGAGQFGRVYTTRQTSSPGASNQKCEAVKVIPKRSIKTPKQTNQCFQECRFLKKLTGHPNIAGFSGLVHARRNLYIFMEYVGSVDLVGTIKSSPKGRLQSSTVLELILQIIDAVAYCHKSRVAHRDIKSENVVITADGTPKLVDFGLAVALSNTEPPELCADQCGTIPFAPPEVYRGKKFDPLAMDVWSLGILTLEMRCGNNSVCRVLGCVGMTEPNNELAEMFEWFFNQPDWPSELQKLNGIGMAPELLAVVRCSLLLSPEDRWHARRLYEHIINCQGDDRRTRSDEGADESLPAGQSPWMPSGMPPRNDLAEDFPEGDTRWVQENGENRYAGRAANRRMQQVR